MELLIGSLFLVSVSLIAPSTLPDTIQLPIPQEGLMQQILNRVRAWRRSATLAGTTFCERCSQVCTATCRRDAQMERVRFTTQRLGFPRF